MSNQNNSNNITSSSVRHLFTLAACAGIVASAVSGMVVSKFDFQSIQSNAATPNSNSVDVIIGQVDTGSNIEVSICVKTDPTNALHITDATNELVYTPATLTPSPTILAAGNYGGIPPTSATSYAPLAWKNVIGTTDKWSLDITYTGGAGTLLSTTTPELVGKVQFAKNGTGGTISSSNSEYFSLETVTSPMTSNIINYTGVCTAYGEATPAIGTPNSSNNLNTQVGGQAPTINLVGNTFATGTPATFTPAGSTTPITGTIIGGNFVPAQGQTIPTNALTGAQNGTLQVGGLSVLVPTNFVATPTTTSGGGTITITTGTNSQAAIVNTTPTVATPSPATPSPVTPPVSVNPQTEITAKAPTKAMKPEIQSGYDSSIDTVRTGGLSINTLIILSILVSATAATAFKMYRTNTKLKYNKNLKID